MKYIVYRESFLNGRTEKETPIYILCYQWNSRWRLLLVLFPLSSSTYKFAEHKLHRQFHQKWHSLIMNKGAFAIMTVFQWILCAQSRRNNKFFIALFLIIRCAKRIEPNETMCNFQFWQKISSIMFAQQKMLIKLPNIGELEQKFHDYTKSFGS